MSRIRRRPARRRAAGTAVAAVAVIALTASACGPGEDDGNDQGADPTPSESADDAAGGDRWADLLDRLPVDFDVDAWVEGEWANWDPDTWLGEAGQYISVIIEEFWDLERIWEAEENDKSVDEDEIDEGEGDEPETDDPADDRGVTDPFPPKVEAAEKQTPYNETAPAVGKLLFETPDGPAACTAAVVKDPDNPGKSNLVATAGHCVHAGAAGGWYRQLVFVPSYNNTNLPIEDLEEGADLADVAPSGIWWTSYVGTTQYWQDNGADVGGAGAHQDFAIMMVEPEDSAVTQSLEEITGAAYEIDFDAPAVSGIGETEVIGYPVAPPYDGQTMYSCTGDLARLSLDATQPVMYSAGCSMTGGSSGGPWISGDKLISVTSIGPADNSWLAGPRLEDDAKAVFDAVRAS